MNSAEKAQEPSMDEIIRSIRSIIADDAQSDAPFPPLPKTANPSASVLKLSEEQIAGSAASATAENADKQMPADTPAKSAAGELTDKTNIAEKPVLMVGASPQISNSVPVKEAMRNASSEAVTSEMERAPIPSTPSVSLRRGATAEEITAALEAMTKLAMPVQAGGKPVSVVVDKLTQQQPDEGRSDQQDFTSAETAEVQTDDAVAEALENTSRDNHFEASASEPADPVEAMLREADQLVDSEDDIDESFIDPLDGGEDEVDDLTEPMASPVAANEADVKAELAEGAGSVGEGNEMPQVASESAERRDAKMFPGAAEQEDVRAEAMYSRQRPVEAVSADRHEAAAVTAVAAATSEAMAGLMGGGMSSAAEGRKDGVRTLEDSVREMLKPLIREWLDKNMPRILEGAIKEEIDSDKN